MGASEREKETGGIKHARSIANDSRAYVALILTRHYHVDISINLDLVLRPDGNTTHVYLRVARFQLASIALAAI